MLEKVRVIVDKVNELKRKLDEANAEKQAVVDNANALASQLNLANRLVNGLADERVRWMSNVDTYKLERLTMIGNAILSAAFVSYIDTIPTRIPFSTMSSLFSSFNQHGHIRVRGRTKGHEGMRRFQFFPDVR